MKNRLIALVCLPLIFLGNLLANERPNILFIAVDDLKPMIGAYGYDAPTPNMDKLAAEGTTFLNAYCQQAVCAPSRVSLMTGRSPDYTKVWDLKTQMRDMRPDILTMPQYFRQNGYETLGVGKIYDSRSVDEQMDEPSWSQPYPPTWSLNFDQELGKATAHYHDPKIKALAAQARDAGIRGWRRLNQFLLRHDGWPSVECMDVPDNAYDDGAIADYAVSSLEKLAGSEQPFFLAVGFKKPHLPFVAPQKYWDMIDPTEIELARFQEPASDSPEMAYHNFGELRSYSDIPHRGPVAHAKQRELIHGYLACVAFIDAQIGKLLAELDRTGLADNTIVVLWGDHGWHLGDHGLWCKHSNFEQATRVPLIMTAPGGVKGQKVANPVELVDLFPTLCQLAGLPIPPDLEGVSLAPVIEKGESVDRQYAMSQFPRGQSMGYALRDDRYRYVAWFNTAGGQAANADGEIIAVELYDYETDPLEKKSLAHVDGFEQIVAEREQALRERLRATSTD